MVNIDNNQSTKQLSKSSCDQLQRKLDPAKTEELDPIISSGKRRKMASQTIIRSPSSLHDSMTPKAEDYNTLMMQKNMPEKNTVDHGAVELWRGNAVGREAKELLEAVEHRYPNTFQSVQIRVKPTWLAILEDFHATIKRFMRTSVDSLTEEQIISLDEDLEELEGFKFDLSWARSRLDMVDRLKFGNEPLHKELVDLEESLEPMKEVVDRRWRQLMEAHDLWKKARLEYDNAKDARDKKVEEMEVKFGADFDNVLKCHLGFGMLLGY